MDGRHEHSRDRGFNLIELLLVIVVLGIVATVVVLSVGGFGGEATEATCLNERRLLQTAGEAYYAQRAAESIPDAGGPEGFERTLVAEGFLRDTSVHYDLDAAGQLLEVAGSPCTV